MGQRHASRASCGGTCRNAMHRLRANSRGRDSFGFRSNGRRDFRQLSPLAEPLPASHSPVHQLRAPLRPSPTKPAAAMPPGSLTSFAARTKTSAACSSGRRQHVILELRAQRYFLHFAGRGVPDFPDEHDVVGHPPFGALAVEEGEQVFFRRALAFLEHDDEQRPLVPFRMAHADYGGFGDFGMTDREVFQFDRGYPFAAGFDHVLRAIGDVEIAVAVDGADIAGVEKTFGVENFAVVLEIGFGHRGTTHFQTAESLAIPRHAFAGIVGDPHLDAERRMALLLLYVEPRLAFEPGIFGLERAERTERTHLRHAPGVDDLDAVDVLEFLGDGARTG